MLDKVSVECAAAIAEIDILIGGLCDLLYAARMRGNEVNTAAAAVIVRSALEVGGRLLWLLDPQIDGVERGRRYLVWRFEDLKQLRYMLQTSSGNSDADAEGVAHADNVERGLVEVAFDAGWSAKPQRLQPSSVEPAALVGEDGKSERMPSYGELAATAALVNDAYKLLSLPAHGQRYEFLATLEPDLDTGQIRIGGSALDPGLLLRWACLSLALPAIALARWNGLSDSRMMTLIAPIAQR